VGNGKEVPKGKENVNESESWGLISPSGPFVGCEQSQERFVFIFLAGSFQATVTDTSLVFFFFRGPLRI